MLVLPYKGQAPVHAGSQLQPMEAKECQAAPSVGSRGLAAGQLAYCSLPHDCARENGGSAITAVNHK